MSERDYYDILGLRFDADGTTVNRTYWLLARKYQAQADSDPQAHRMLDDLNEAYGVLGTPVLREAYDLAHPELADPDSASPPGRGGAAVRLATAFTAILLGVAHARHKRSGAPAEPSAAVDPGVDAMATPAVAHRRSAQEPLSASIVRGRGTSADELRASTASMVHRWRSTVAVANPEAGETERGPDPTLVDIFRSEEEVETPSEPLSAVLDVLRGSRHPV